MITSVATWRCNCGAGIKVVTETDRGNSEELDRLKAACPNCGDPQIIYGHRIVTITVERQWSENSSET
jgi:hypothetical protein